MRTTYRFISVVASCVLLITCVFAQDEDTTRIVRNVDVVNAYQPVLRKAKKIRVAPQMEDTLSFKPQFEYTVLNRVASVSTKPEKLTAADMRFPSYEIPYRTILKGSVGTLPGLFGQMVFNSGNSSDFHFSADAGHSAMFGKVKLDDDCKVKAPQNDTWAKVALHSFADDFRFGASLVFKNSLYDYYGLNSLNDDCVYSGIGTVIGLHGSELNGLKQRNTSVDVAIDIANAEVDPREGFSYKARTGFGIFGNKSGVRQIDFNFNGSLRFPILDAGAFDADLSFKYYKVCKGDESGLYVYNEHKGVDVCAAPHILLEYDFMKLTLGVRIVASVGDDFVKDDFFIQPDVNANFFIGDGHVRFYAGMTGDYCSNSFRTLLNQNRYVASDCRKYLWSKKDSCFVSRSDISPSFSPIVFKAGLRSTFGSSVQLHLGFDYRSLTNEVFFVNSIYYLADDELGAKPTTCHGSDFAILQDDGKLLRLHGELNINPTYNSNISIGAGYFDFKMDYEEEAWNKPTYEFILRGYAHPMVRLKLRGSMTVDGKRYAYNPTEKVKMEMPLLVDLNIGADYYFSNRWTIFFDVNNISCANQQLWLGYSSYTLSVWGGLTYKF